MTKTCKFCWALSALLFLTVLGMAYLFLLRGNITASDDGRTAIAITAGERNLVLGDMRGFLEAVQAITSAAAEGDMSAAAEAASAVGMASAGNAPPTLMGKLPLEFKTLGLETHSLFDDLAKAASDNGDASAVMAGLGDLMLNCTSCHAGYKLVTETTGSGDTK